MEYRFGDITVACTNTDRIVFPDSGITKGDVLAYYHRVADVMVPELRDRALSMERFTKGIDKGGFFQKHAQKHFPAWIDHAVLGGKTRVEYPICNSAAALVYFANQGGVAFHIWTSHASTPAVPDQIVFDLDPPDGGFELVREVARLLHALLDELGLTAFVKTTGSKGLHVIVPIDDTSTYDAVHQLSTAIATRLCTRHPELVTIEFYKKDRKGRLYFDTMRNALGATFVAAYFAARQTGLCSDLGTGSRGPEVRRSRAIRPDGIRLRDVRARASPRTEIRGTRSARNPARSRRPRRGSRSSISGTAP